MNYKVYIQIDGKNQVTAIGSSAFIQDTTNWIEIDEGTDDRYIYAHYQYFTNPIVSTDGIYQYKYENGKISERTDEEKLADLITKIRAEKITKFSEQSTQSIYAGVDVEYNGKTSHYSLTQHDQSNIISLTATAQTGASVPYHADGELCRIYSPEEFLQVSSIATKYIVYKITYFNMLKHMIEDITSIDELSSLNYGDPLNDKYQALFDEIINSNS